jgi:hypothetical protein
LFQDLDSRYINPSRHVPFGWHSFLGLLLPSLACYYATALLVLHPKTFLWRLMLLPLTLDSMFRAATQLDMSSDEWTVHRNQALAVCILLRLHRYAS